MTHKSTRNTNIEILRLILMLAIFVWHILVHGYNLKDIDGTSIIANNTQLIMLALLSPATYCFMFISGYFGIPYSNKRFGHLIFMCISSLLITSIIAYTIKGSIPNILSILFPLTKGPWWFIYWYIIIMVVSPIINTGITIISKEQFRIILIIMLYFLIASIVQLKVNNGSNFIGLLTIYLLGRYIKIHKIKPSMPCATGAYIISALCMIISILCTNSIKPDKVFVLLSYCNPLIITMAVSIFFITLNIQSTYNSIFNKILSPLLAIYLLTEGLGKWLYDDIASIMSNSILVGCVIILAISIGCIIIGHILNTIYEYIYKKNNSTIKT